MNWKNIKITILKELRGIVRDKKSLQKLILYPLLIPIVILLFGYLFDSLEKSNYTIGINYELTSEENSIINNMGDIVFKEYKNKNEIEEAYKEEKIDGYIIKNDNKYTIYVDETKNSGEIILSISKLYLESYSKLLGSKYLLENEIDPNYVFNNIVVESESLSKSDVNPLINMVYSLVIAYIIMIIVVVCVVVVSDATSGEKERGTLETILTFPIKSFELIIGKYLATAILGFISGMIAYLLSFPTFHFGKKLFESYEDVVFTTNIKTISLVFIVIILTALLSSGICMALAGKSRSYKEAQSSLQFVSIIPMMSYFFDLLEINSSIINFVPIANCSSLLRDIVADNINYQSLSIIIISTIIYTVIILIYISKQYMKEEVLFS